ncbi:hypothetical protein G9A89_008491 [Geosiphon pyriformis]|nr:hypothetical protein G9A89_008491 [Geosiphon pyriformis]
MTSGEGSLGALQPSQPAVSKKAKKRLIKQQQWEAQRDARKEARKKKEQEKKAKKQTQKNEEEAARKLTQGEINSYILHFRWNS